LLPTPEGIAVKLPALLGLLLLVRPAAAYDPWTGCFWAGDNGTEIVLV